MADQLRLLSEPTNFAIVQLPGRSYPGVVVQGDTLHSFIQRLDDILKSLATEENDLTLQLTDLREELLQALRHYETICASNGIGLPYGKGYWRS